MKNNLKRILLFVLLFANFDITTFAQRKSKGKIRTHQSHKIHATSSDNGEYYNGHKIFTGPRGGKYYINSNGKKTYI